VIKRRPDRIAAALLLTALLASLSLLTHPSGNAAATATSPVPDIAASIQYGCATGPDPSFVEVTLVRPAANGDALTVQIGLTGQRSTHGESHYLHDGGPSLVTLTADRTVIRLAGSPVANDQVFVRRIDQPAMLTLPVPANCAHIAKTDFGLIDADVEVSKSACTGTQAKLVIAVTSSNDVAPLSRFGYQSLDYTVLLVKKADGTLAGVPTAGRLVPFTAPGRQSVTVLQTATSPVSYEVRVIGPDGVTDVSGVRTLSCESVGGNPSPSSSFTLPPPVRHSSSAPASSPGSTPTASPSRTHSRPNHSPSATPTKSSPAVVNHSQPGGGPVVNPGSSNDQPVLGAAAETSHSVPAKPASRPASKPSVPVSKSKEIVADPPRFVSALRMGSTLSTSALLIVLVFAASMAGLVGSTVRSARRR
jgi:hypothetical protein